MGMWGMGGRRHGDMGTWEWEHRDRDMGTQGTWGTGMGTQKGHGGHEDTDGDMGGWDVGTWGTGDMRTEGTWAWGHRAGPWGHGEQGHWGHKGIGDTGLRGVAVTPRVTLLPTPGYSVAVGEFSGDMTQGGCQRVTLEGGGGVTAALPPRTPP